MSLTRDQVLMRIAQRQPVMVDNVAFCTAVETHWVCLARWDRHTWTIPPEKKMVPLEACDITLGRDQFRPFGSPWHRLAIGVSQELVDIGREGRRSYDVLRDSYERSTDGGNTWQRCEKEVEQ
jgi:hypothetical protein